MRFLTLLMTRVLGRSKAGSLAVASGRVSQSLWLSPPGAPLPPSLPLDSWGHPAALSQQDPAAFRSPVRGVCSPGPLAVWAGAQLRRCPAPEWRGLRARSI
ncbi:hypothetical protein SKAU_G00429330 [Synaphobranchus kaupii]|uniref:Uncharacterized protein n=1 Tax=Synaphobranchus kaupii TaxID=118154 RepID=A0A9Q1E4J5_SYNKA|nr:hypothetical protein SKAU_G00429330 [Synaphobranchus kaupii]